jgi:SulP family sulfate permease
VVVFLGILIIKISGIDKYGVLIVGDIPKGLPTFEVPTFDYESMIKLIPVAFTLAFIGFIEAFSIGKSLEDVESEQRISANQEFRAIGLGNIVGSFFLSFNATSSFSRSAVNNNSGANTQLSSIFASFIVGLTLLFLTPVFYYLPKAVVAAIIIIAVAGLFDYKTPLHLWKYDKKDALILLATFLITILFGIKEGIFTGVVLSIVMMIYNSTKPHIAVLGRIPNTIMYRNVGRFNDVEIDSKILIIRFDSQLNFTNSAIFKDIIIAEVNKKGPELKALVINANSLSKIDSSGVYIIKDIISYLKKRNIELYFTGIIGPVRDTFHKSELIEEIGLNKCYLNIQSAVDSFYKIQDEHLIMNKEKYINQVNLK